MATQTNLATIRTFLWIAVALAAIALAAIYLGAIKQGRQSGAKLYDRANIGGAFELTSHKGTQFSSASLKGKPYMIFFGFTHCPDVCPTTLLEVTNALKDLGSKAEMITVLFVTVDPKRDTQEALKEYLQAFDSRIIGLTGTEEEIARIAKLYLVKYKKVPTTNDNYNMDHTASVLLFDKNGKLVSTLSWQESAETRKKKLENLVSQ